MARQTFEELLSDAAAVFQQEQNRENNKAVDSVSALLPSPTAIFPQRRCDARMDYRQMCPYEIRETIPGAFAVIGEGGASWSMGARKDTSPHGSGTSHEAVNQVHISCSRWRRIVSTFQPRWTKSRQVESHADPYLVGCRGRFGPCEYSCF